MLMYDTAYLYEYADRWYFLHLFIYSNFILLGEVKCDTIIGSVGMFLYTGQ